jgi:GAF domain-containing protein
MPSSADSDAERVSAIHALGLLQSDSEERFDRIARVAALALDAPFAVFSVVTRDRQFFKARYGMEIRDTARDISFCTHALSSDEAFVIPDAGEDPRFATNPLVIGEPRIRFYAGHPVRAPSGPVLGTLCILDRQPRPGLTDRQLSVLRDLVVMLELELGRASVGASTESALAGEHVGARKLRSAETAALLNVDAGGKIVLEGDLRVRRFNARAREFIALDEQVIGAPIDQLASFVDYPAMLTDLENAAAFGEATERRVLSITGRLLQAQVFPFREPGAGRHCVLLCFTDITTVQRAEQSNAIFDGLFDPVCVLDRSGRVRDTNLAWDLQAAHEGDPLALRSGPGSNLPRVFSTEGGAEGRDIGRALDEVVTGKRSRFSALYERRLPRGERRLMLLRATSINHHDVAATVSQTDVTPWVTRGDGDAPPLGAEG